LLIAKQLQVLSLWQRGKTATISAGMQGINKHDTGLPTRQSVNYCRPSLRSFFIILEQLLSSIYWRASHVNAHSLHQNACL